MEKSSSLVGSSTSESTTAETASDLSKDCNRALSRIISSAASSESHDLAGCLEDSRARFRVWASNIGAFQPSNSRKSLDYRLRQAPLMRESVSSGLHRLLSTTSRAIDIICGSVNNRTASNTTSSPQTSFSDSRPMINELDELLRSIDSAINHMFSLSILIRRQRPKGRLPALDDYHPAEQSPDISNVIDKFPKSRQLPWLARRLGNATTQRRQLIQYRQLHRERLAKQNRKVATVDVGGDDSATISGTVVASTFATTFEEGDISYSEEQLGSEAMKNRISVLTSATSFLSVGENESMGRRIPSLSDMILDGVQLDYGREFECPYCRTIQIVFGRFEWKKHVFTDLQPYVCTFEDCVSSSQLFPTRSEWFKHETSLHRREWICILCNDSNKPCKTAKQLEQHLISAHNGEITSSQFDMLVEACERPIKTFETASCPLCTDWKPLTTEDNAKNFSRHLARHLQQLALEALPLAVQGLEIQYPDEEDDEGEVDSNESDAEDGLSGNVKIQEPEDAKSQVPQDTKSQESKDITIEEEEDFKRQETQDVKSEETEGARHKVQKDVTVEGEDVNSEEDAEALYYEKSKRWGVALPDSPARSRSRASAVKYAEPPIPGPSTVDAPLIPPTSASVPRYCFAEDKFWFVVDAKFGRRRYELNRYYEDFYDLQIALLKQFPVEAGTTGAQRILPYMPGPVTYLTDAITEGRMHNLDTYVKALLKLPLYISQSTLVRIFFAPREGDYEYQLEPEFL